MLLADAEYWLGQLVGLGGLLHNANTLAAPYIRQEAVRSSQIEGTRTSLGELAAFEAAGGPPPDADAQETLNYVAALDEGLRPHPRGRRRSTPTSFATCTAR